MGVWNRGAYRFATGLARYPDSEFRAALFAKQIAADPRFQVAVVVMDHDNRGNEHAILASVV